jgi:hypothetical protein
MAIGRNEVGVDNRSVNRTERPNLVAKRIWDQEQVLGESAS